MQHKTFHRYVVRAKRGTAQSQRDKQGNAPRSAGATLRRYNETALTQVGKRYIQWKNTSEILIKLWDPYQELPYKKVVL